MGKKAREFRKRNLWLTESVAEYMKLVTDPRDRRGLRHELWVILVLILIGYLNGRTTVCSIERFLRSKKKMLRGLLPLENGIPSHCTFSRILQRLSYEELYHVFLLWIGDILSESHGSEGHVMIDGKGIRASRPSDESKTPLCPQRIAGYRWDTAIYRACEGRREKQ